MRYEKIRNRRKELNITELEMAQKLGLKTRSAYYKKENKMVSFTIEEAKIVAETLGKGLDELFL